MKTNRVDKINVGKIGSTLQHFLLLEDNLHREELIIGGNYGSMEELYPQLS